MVGAEPRLVWNGGVLGRPHQLTVGLSYEHSSGTSPAATIAEPEAGAFGDVRVNYRTNELLTNELARFPRRAGRFEVDNYGAYLQSELRVTDRTTITTGLRWEPLSAALKRQGRRSARLHRPDSHRPHQARIDDSPIQGQYRSADHACRSHNDSITRIPMKRIRKCRHFSGNRRRNGNATNKRRCHGRLEPVSNRPAQLDSPEIHQRRNLPQTDVGNPQRLVPRARIQHTPLAACEAPVTIEPVDQDVRVEQRLQPPSPDSTSHAPGPKTGPSISPTIWTVPTSSS